LNEAANRHPGEGVTRQIRVVSVKKACCTIRPANKGCVMVIREWQCSLVTSLRKCAAVTRAAFSLLFVAVCSSSGVANDPVRDKRDEPIAPRDIVSLFNQRDLSGLSTWLKDAQHDDPRRVFRVTDGMLHITGDGFGYVGTQQAYRDYHLTVEYRWGAKTDGGKYVRNSGIMLHATGPDGGAGGTWASSFECQLAQGCCGDIIVIRGRDASGEVIPVQLTTETELAPDKRRHRWKAGGEVKTFPPTRGQLWWSKHDWDFQELLDTRGRNDIEKPTGEWNTVECVCSGDRISIIVNGETVNQCAKVSPAGGRILLQCEGFELFVRKFELRPLRTSSETP
jgi:Domain of Unknown Function (DUF1080)